MTRHSPETASPAAAPRNPKASTGSQPCDTAKPAEYSVAANGTVSNVIDQEPTHLLVMANGIGSCAAHWANMKAHLEATLGGHVLIHVSTTNQGFRTQQGIDVCGERLAAEIRSLAESHPSLSEVSVLGHSMGGLIARAAAGLLFDPATNTVAGLRPAAYVSLVSPHLGITCADTQAQLPFIVWGGAVWGVGGLLRAALKPVAGAVARLMSATTRQFFGLDACSTSGSGGSADGVGRDGGMVGGHGNAPASSSEAAGGSGCSPTAAAAAAGGSAPLLARLCVDEPSCGRLCFSALAAFRVRVAYSVVSGDQWVRWANGAIAREHELPLVPNCTLASAAGVVHEHDEHDDAQGRWPCSPADNTPVSTAVDHASVDISDGGGGGAPAEPTRRAVHAAGNGSGVQGMPRGEWGDAARVEFIVSQLQRLRWRRVSVSFRGDSLLGGVPHHRVQARSSVRSRGADAVKAHLGGLMAAYLGGVRCSAGGVAEDGDVCDATQLLVRAGG